METNSQKYHRLVKESKQYYQQTHGRHGGAIRDSGHLDLIALVLEKNTIDEMRYTGSKEDLVIRLYNSLNISYIYLNKWE